MATNNPNPNQSPNPNPSPNPAGGGAAPAPPVITSLADKAASKTKVSIETRYQTLVEGLLANFAQVSTFALSTGTYTLDALVAKIREGITAAEATKSAKTNWHTTVQTERQVDVDLRPLRKQLQQYVAARYGASSAKMAEFGFTPVKPRKTKVATKATAATKAQATRKARGTMGSKQRKTVKAPAATPTATPIATTAPAATSSPPGTTAPSSPTGGANK
jgi:hypothetical protein